jgi:hypothetical protein
MPERLRNPIQLWRPLSSWRDESDYEFVVWHVRAENDDGRVQTVLVKVDARTVADEQTFAGGDGLFEVRDAIETRGMSVVEQRQAPSEPSLIGGLST